MPTLDSLLTKEYITKNYKNIKYSINPDNSICISAQPNQPYFSHTLRVFPGDCGTLILQGVSTIKRKILDIVKDIASFCGYDTVICTYLHIAYGDKEEDRKTEQEFKTARWMRAVVGKSNRKYNCKTNTKIVYICHIRNCKHKGY